MKVLYVLDSLGSGGAQRQAVELARSLRAGYAVETSVLVYHEDDFFGPVLVAAGVPIYVVPKRIRVDPIWLARVAARVRAIAPDVVHSFMLPPAAWALMALRLLAPSTRPALVSAQRDSLIHEGITGWIQRFVYRSSDAVTVNAESAGTALVARLGLDERRVHCLPNGIDLDAFDEAGREPSPYALEPDEFHFALIGGLRPEKNHELVIDALTRIPPGRRRRWRVWFIGDETGGAETAARIRQRIAETGLSRVVQIVPATLHIPAVLSRVQVLLLPSAHEGFPNALLEGMASGVPSIATAVGEVPRLLRGVGPGVMLKRADAAELAEAMLALAELPEADRRALGGIGRARVEESYRMVAVAPRYLALYESVARRALGAR